MLSRSAILVMKIPNICFYTCFCIFTQSRRFARAMKAPLIFCSTAESINVQKIFKIVLAKVCISTHPALSYSYTDTAYSSLSTALSCRLSTSNARYQRLQKRANHCYYTWTLRPLFYLLSHLLISGSLLSHDLLRKLHHNIHSFTLFP